MTVQKDGKGTTKADFDDVPIVTAVRVIADEEMPSANNPNHVPIHATAIPTASTSTITVPSGSAIIAAPNSTVVTKTTPNNSRIALNKNLGRRSSGLQCQHCQRETITVVEDRIGVGTVFAAILVTLIFWPAAFLVFCLPMCKQTVHFCGHDSCKKKLGVTNVCA